MTIWPWVETNIPFSEDGVEKESGSRFLGWMASTIKSNSGNSFDSLVLITAKVLMFAPKPAANSMRLLPFEMQGVEGEEVAFLLLLPPQFMLVATCHWQPFLWNSLCRLTSPSFEAGFRWRDNYQSFRLPAESEAALATHGGRSTAVEELDLKVKRKKTIYQFTNIAGRKKKHKIYSMLKHQL